MTSVDEYVFMATTTDVRNAWTAREQPSPSEPLEEAEAPLDGHGNGVKADGRGIEGERDCVEELGVHEERLRRVMARRQLVLDLTDERDRNAILKLIDRSIEVEDLYDLEDRTIQSASQSINHSINHSFNQSIKQSFIQSINQ